MALYSELELRYARPIANALIQDNLFRRWVLVGTKFESAAESIRPIGDVQAKLRSRSLKNPYWFNYWCGKDSKCTCKIGSGIETDILLIFEYADRRKLAAHVEVKRPSEHLGIGQAESYPRRAACWANAATRPKTVVPHDDFLTVIVCGQELGSDERLHHFDRVIFHDAVSLRIENYPEKQDTAVIARIVDGPG